MKKKLITLAIIVIPYKNPNQWIVEQYRKIPKNNIHFVNHQIQINVNKSASPLFYHFKDEVIVKDLFVSGVISDLPKLVNKLNQGQKGSDDFSLKIGLIVLGKKRLSFVQKMFAPSWIKKLYKIFSAKHGLSHVEFFNITQNKNFIGTSRIHPSSKFIKENFIYHIKKKGKFLISYKFKKPFKILGLWISSDGDDTKSSFQVDIKKMSFNNQK